MDGLNLIVVSFLLLAPIQYPGSNGVKEISGEHGKGAQGRQVSEWV